MTEPTRSARSRRSGRRPGWVLLSALLVLAIGASSALVFTNRVELLKLAVILSLWAAVVAAFVSVIYRRQSDVDQAKVRDLKLVYDLQLDREISARREYELSVETQLRRELVSELRAQAADEVAGLRAELAALRANLEILFDADLSDRPALETDRSYGEWSSPSERAGRVTASRIDTDADDDHDPKTDESPIIDVPEEPGPPDSEWAQSAADGGAHRLPSDVQREGRRRAAEERTWSGPSAAPPPPIPEAEPVTRETQLPWLSRPGAGDPRPPDWQPAPAEGLWIPAGAPGSNWVQSTGGGTAESSDYVGRRRAPESTSEASPEARPAEHPQPAMSSPPPEPPRGRHSAGQESADQDRSAPPPTLATEPATPPSTDRRRHRSADDTGGQSVAELLARLQATPSGGGRRRRREE
jgi:hypothetical protein